MASSIPVISVVPVWADAGQYLDLDFDITDSP